MTQPSVAIVILNYNGSNYLRRFLPSVFTTSYNNKRIIVADNASTDDSIELLKEQFPLCELILLDQNYGFAGGYNKALQQVKSDYYILLNSDVEVDVAWIEPVIELMENDTNIAACQPKILSYHQKTHFEYAGAAGGWIDYLGYPFSRGRVFDYCEIDEGQYNDNQAIFWASGAAMFVRSEIFHTCKGFDDWFFAHMEEIDLCWRMQRAGYKIMACPKSVVYHMGGGTLPQGNKRKVYLNFRNNLVMLSKNLPLFEKLWKLPFRFLLDALFAWKNLLTGYPQSFIAILKAHISVIRWWLRKKEKNHLAKKPMKALTGVYLKSLIVAHFIKKKNRFSEIISGKR